MISWEVVGDNYMSKWHQSLNYGTKKVSLTRTRKRTRNGGSCSLCLLFPMVLTKISFIFISLEALFLKKKECRSSEASEKDLLFHYLLANTRIPMVRAPCDLAIVYLLSSFITWIIILRPKKNQNVIIHCFWNPQQFLKWGRPKRFLRFLDKNHASFFTSTSIKTLVNRCNWNCYS